MNLSPQGSFGSRLNADGAASFRLWAPGTDRVALQLEQQQIDATSREGGWFEVTAEARPGARYCWRLESGLCVPDPASRMQARDVHGESVLVDPGAYKWRTNSWTGRPWEEVVLYELHTGLLGGFDGVAERLPALRDLGVTAVELMPVNAFPGRRNWGYDGVLPYAPANAYGGPERLKALVDRAHELGLMTFLDVVYNHFGPDGNYLALYAPQFFRGDLETPWGPAIDFRRAEVRRYFTENALYWVEEFRFDGLRFDAVHAISEPDWLEETADAIRATAGPDRHIHLVLENDKNAPRHLERCFEAQWNDDIHHVVHHLLTREQGGYYAAYSDRAAERLARALKEGFIYQGEPFGYGAYEPRGAPSAHLPPTAFVSFLQNHDQIGNRALGERLATLADPGALQAAIALMLLAPQIPLIFMGEETGSTSPFLFFTDHKEELAAAVREGRRREFAGFPEFADERSRERIPDPNAEETFEASHTAIAGDDAGRTHQEFYRHLLAIRKEHIIPRLSGARSLDAVAVGPSAILASWRMGDGALLTIVANLGEAFAEGQLPTSAPLVQVGDGLKDDGVAPRTTIVWLEARHGG